MIGIRSGIIAHESIATGRNESRLTGTNSSVNELNAKKKGVKVLIVTNSSVNELNTKGKGVKVLIATNSSVNELNTKKKGVKVLIATNSNRPTKMSLTGLKMAGGNVNQANAAGSAGKAMTKTGAVTSDELKNPAMIPFI